MSGPTGGVSSFNGRTGPVVSQTGDYDAAQVGAVPAPVMPPPRSGAAGARDPNGAALLFGGDGNSDSYLADTWLWGAPGSSGWEQVFAAPSPPGRNGAGMAYDANLNRTVLFGGLAAGNVFLADTWVWDGQAWSDISGPGPAGRIGHVLFYDPASQRVILFGGENSQGYLADTWELVNNAWVQVNPTTSPPGRVEASAGVVGAGPYGLMFGGHDAAGNLGDTWTYANGEWTELSPTTAPSARDNAQMVGDDTGALTLFGGNDGNPMSDVWTWDAATSEWSEMAQPAAAPIARYGGNYIYPGIVCMGTGGFPAPADTNNLGDTWYGPKGEWSPREVGAGAAPLVANNPIIIGNLGASPWTFSQASDAMVIVTGGTVSEIAINGVNTGLASGVFYLPANYQFTITYTAAPTFTVFAA